MPAPFRAILRADSADGLTTALVLRPSDRHPAIEAWPVSGFDALAARLDNMDLFSPDEDDLTTALYAAAFSAEADKEGRIGLPERLAKHAALGETAFFLGKNRYFEIWEPEGGARRMADASQGVATRRLTLPAARA